MKKKRARKKEIASEKFPTELVQDDLRQLIFCYATTAEWGVHLSGLLISHAMDLTMSGTAWDEAKGMDRFSMLTNVMILKNRDRYKKFREDQSYPC